MPFRVWNYVFRIWDDLIKQEKYNGNRLNKLPMIVPMVFYHGNKPWNASKDLKDIIEGDSDIVDSILFKPFYLIDTNDISDETLREQHIVGLMTFIMKSIFVRDIMNIKETLFDMIINLIEKEPEGSNTSELLKTLLKYLIRYGTVSKPKDFSQELTQKILTRRKSMGNIAEYFMQEGLKRGRNEGRHEGEILMLKTY